MLRQPAPGTGEVAVMLDARDALEIAEDALAIEWEGYVDSWQGGGA
jgi:homogentisate 1,2-dioxygenase